MLDMFFKMRLMEIMATTETITSFLLSSWLSLGGNDLVLLSVELYKRKMRGSNQNEDIIGKILYFLRRNCIWPDIMLFWKLHLKYFLVFCWNLFSKDFLMYHSFWLQFLSIIFELIHYVYLVLWRKQYSPFFLVKVKSCKTFFRTELNKGSWFLFRMKILPLAVRKTSQRKHLQWLFINHELPD